MSDVGSLEPRILLLGFKEINLILSSTGIRMRLRVGAAIKAILGGGIVGSLEPKIVMGAHHGGFALMGFKKIKLHLY